LLRLALIAALNIAILSPAQQESRSAGARKLVSLEGRFSISLPHRSSSRKLIIPTPSGTAYGDLYEWRTKEATFAVGYADTLQPIDGPEAVKQFFDKTTERFTRLALASGGRIAVSKKITLDNHPGIEQHADVFAGSFIQRTYLVSRRIYETVAVLTDSQRDESTAVSVLNTFKLLSDPEITEEALKTPPGPLPQTPEAPRAGSDADEEELRGPVKSVRIEIQYLSETPFTEGRTRSWLTTYNEKRNKVRTESYDFKNNLILITVYGYVDGSRVSASKYIQREYGPTVGSGAGGYVPSNKKVDPRYQQRFEYKYDDKKRLIEKTDFSSNGDMMERSVYKYEGNQREELVYSRNGQLMWRNVYILDDKGNVIEVTDYGYDGSVSSKVSYAYEFDSNGNWTKRTMSRYETSEMLRQHNPPSVHVRTITYYRP
jgi:hypothetical protein